MAGGLHDEGFVDDERRGLEAGVEIAVRPLVGRLAHRQAAFGRVREILRGPFQHLHLRPRRRRRRAGVGAAGTGVTQTLPSRRAFGLPGPQALDRIGDERQRLEIEIDALDRRGGGRFVDRGDGENRLALIERLVGQRALGALAGPADRRR